MVANLYKHEETQVILYEELGLLPDKESKLFTLVSENVNPEEYPDVQIIRYNSAFKMREKALEKAFIRSTKDLSSAYNLVLNKALNAPKRIRDYVVEKYPEVMEFIHIKEIDEA